MLSFTLIMLVLALTAHVRGPVLNYASALWFFISWLPGELPWLFAALQLVMTCVLLALSDTIGLKEWCSLALATVTLVMWFYLHQKTWRAGLTLQAALRNALGQDIDSRYLDSKVVASPPVIQHRDWLRPFHFKRAGVERLQNISYGDAARNRLDIYRSQTPLTNAAPRPVLLHIHGGAWVLGHKYQQAQPLINYLAQNDWICVDINYRLAPKNRYPDCLVDVKKAIVWIKENIADYGGDPTFIAMTGGSAGGHLCALAALTANDPTLQPGFETSDTRVQAAVPIYGVYDFTHHQRDGLLMRGFLERYVMHKSFTDDAVSWNEASPLFRTKDVNVPFFVLHGDKDCVVPVQQAQDFVEALKQHNSAPVVYAELNGAQHGYDVFHSVRTEFHMAAVGKFLHYCYAGR